MDPNTRAAMQRNTAKISAVGAHAELDAELADIRAELGALGPYDPPERREALLAAMENNYFRRGYSTKPVINGVVMNGAAADFSGGLDPNK